MAKIVGGIACSHVPAIGAALDKGNSGNPYWKPYFDGTVPAREWLAKLKPDVASSSTTITPMRCRWR